MPKLGHIRPSISQIGPTLARTSSNIVKLRPMDDVILYFGPMLTSGACPPREEKHCGTRVEQSGIDIWVPERAKSVNKCVMHGSSTVQSTAESCSKMLRGCPFSLSVALPQIGEVQVKVIALTFETF